MRSSQPAAALGWRRHNLQLRGAADVVRVLALLSPRPPPVACDGGVWCVLGVVPVLLALALTCGLRRERGGTKLTVIIHEFCHMADSSFQFRNLQFC